LHTYSIAVLPGDGIGTEVMAATLDVLDALQRRMPDLSLSFCELPIGVAALNSEGDPLPNKTIATAKEADGILHGAIDGAAIPASYRAPLTGLRRTLDAYASVRPSISYPGVAALHRNVDLVVVRETTEGLYSKIEYTIGPDVACSVRTVTRAGTERITKRAFEMATRRRKSVTVAHKRAGLPVADGFMLEVVRSVAKSYPEVELREANIDALCQDLIQRPHEFDVVLAENQYGDILSDVASAVAGGLGLAASGCVGDRWAYFEPVHGTAPDIAGRGLANPSAMMLAAAMMFDHIGESGAARVVRTAVTDVLADGRTITADLGGSASTTDFTAAVVAQVGRTQVM
jgi:isocitrate dehydrogenase (NAD+)